MALTITCPVCTQTVVLLQTRPVWIIGAVLEILDDEGLETVTTDNQETPFDPGDDHYYLPYYTCGVCMTEIDRAYVVAQVRPQKDQE